MTSLRLKKGKNDDGIGINSMILLSFLLHALVLSITFLSPSWPTPRWTFGPAYTVDLVSTPATLVETKTSAVSSREIIGIGPRERSVVIKKKVSTIESTPIKTLKTTTNVSTGEVDKAIESIRRKEQTAGPAAGRQASSQDNVEMNMKMKVYYSVIWSQIREQWALPEGILPQDDYEAIIAVKILRNGEVAEFDFEKRSGNKYFDESTVKAIKKASPFPPLPEWLQGSSLEIGIRFHSTDL
jgi:colicin import membrane protein